MTALPRGIVIERSIISREQLIALPKGILITQAIRTEELFFVINNSGISTFTYTGLFQTFTVPAGITQITVYMWGAGGGGAFVTSGFTPGNGGAGAMVQGLLSVTPGSTLTIIVGGGGSFGRQTDQTDAEGGGGLAYYDSGSTLWGAGSGGGRSAIQFIQGGSDIVVAGGGGGGGVVNSGTPAGGSATFSGTANGGTAATGGSQLSGGSAGSSGAGGALKFGGKGWNSGSFGGAGGGGGYYGGGGGGVSNGYGSGGGGSSFTGNISAIPGQPLGFTSSDGRSAPNTSSPYYIAGVGVGGPSSSTGGGPGTINLGGNGLVIILYNATTKGLLPLPRGFSITRPILSFELALPVVISGPTTYRFFRFHVTDVRSWVNFLQYSEFRLYNNGVRLSLAGATAEGSSPDGPPVYGGGEGPSNAIDNNTSTKVGTLSRNFILTVTLVSPVIVSHFSYVTANDSDNRDPSIWTVSASTDGVTYIVLHTQSTPYSAPTARFTETALFPLTAV